MQETERADPWADAAPPTISRAEIEGLLAAGAGAGGPSAMEQILAAGLVLHERMPMLDVVLDRLIRLSTTTIRNMLAVRIEIGIEQVSTVRFGDALERVAQPAILGVFRAEEWENKGIMVVEPDMVSALVDVALGGRSAAPVRIEGRAFTPIERGLVGRLVERLLDDLATSFLPLCSVGFALERLETNPRAASIVGLNSAAVEVRLRVEAGNREGTLRLILPYATLEPIRELLIQQFMGEKFGRDTIWEGHLREELWSTDIALDAILEERTLRLSEVVGLQVGDRLALDITRNDPIVLRCVDTPVFTARLGRKNGRIAVRLEDRLAGQAQPV